jgi:hypothetical protein
VLGVVRLVDVPADGDGRRYVIERGLTCMAELESPTTSSRPRAGTRSPPSRAVCSTTPGPPRDDRARPLTERDLLIATLTGRYIERRERGEAPCVHDVLAVAAEFGDGAADDQRCVLAVYEALRACEIDLH